MVIADDLSGATDVGVQFASKGIKTLVLRHTQKERVAGAFDFSDVVLIDSQSRHLPASEAAGRVLELISQGKQRELDCTYKKTDSTLRGNVGAELAALLKASGLPALCFIPAHPVLGRTTRDGLHYVEGQLLHESSYSEDRLNPVQSSNIKEILHYQTDVPISIFAPEEARQVLSEAPAGIIVFSVETMSQLRSVATAIKEAGLIRILAGSAALAGCLPELLQFEGGAIPTVDLREPFLVINGSLNEQSFNQCRIACLKEFEFLRVTAADLFGPSSCSLPEQCAELLLRGRSVVISTLSSGDEVVSFKNSSTQSQYTG